MPWRRFEELYKAHAKRKAVESAEATRNAMIAGLWGNSNYDDDKGTRDKAIKEINENFYNSLTSIYTGEKPEDVDLNTDPFFAAMKVPEIPEEMSVPTTTTDVASVDQA